MKRDYTLVSTPTHTDSVPNRPQLEPTLRAWGKRSSRAGILFLLLVAPIPLTILQQTTPSRSLRPDIFTTHSHSPVPRSPTAPLSLLTTTTPFAATIIHTRQPHSRFSRAFQALSSLTGLATVPAFLTSPRPTRSPPLPTLALHSSGAPLATRHASTQPWATTTTHTAVCSAA